MKRMRMPAMAVARQIVPVCRLLAVGCLTTGSLAVFAVTAPAGSASASVLTSATFTSGTASLRAGGHTWASARSLSFTSSRSGIVTGSATLSNGKLTPSLPPQTCTLVGKTYIQHEASYRAKFKSPAGHAFAAHTLLTGTIKVKSSGSGFFTIVTLKRK